MDSFNVGNGDSEIFFSTTISTVGLARTRGVVFNPETTEIITTRLSDDASGGISNSPIGAAGILQNKRLSVLTEINLELLTDYKERENEFKKIEALYFLKKGKEAEREFNSIDNKEASDDFKTVAILKEIDLIP